MADSNGKAKQASMTTIAEVATDALAGMLKALHERGLTCEAVLVLTPPGDETEEVLILQMLQTDTEPEVRGLQILEFAVKQIKAAPERFQEMEDPDG